jgi:UDP-glucose 4-epimerase
MIEQALEWYHRIHGLRFAALRYSMPPALWRWGECAPARESPDPACAPGASGRRSELHIFGDDTLRRTGPVSAFIHVADLVAAHRRCALDTRPHQVYNPGSGLATCLSGHRERPAVPGGRS